MHPVRPIQPKNMRYMRYTDDTPPSSKVTSVYRSPLTFGLPPQ